MEAVEAVKVEAMAVGGYRGRMPFISRAFKSPIVEITSDTFKTGQSKFAAQFTQSRKTLPVIFRASLERKHIW